MKFPPANKVSVVDQNKTDVQKLACVRLLTDDAMEGKAAGEIVYVDMATAEKLIVGLFAELAEE